MNLLFNIVYIFIEDNVISKIKEFLTKDNINHIASTMVSLIEEEQDNLRLSQLNKSIINIDRKKTNLISVIAECDDSNIRKSLYEELSSIKQQRINIESDILSEESIINTLSKTNIKRFLNQLKDGNEKRE